MTPVMKVFTLGGLKLRLDDQPIPDLANSKAEALLVYLACTGRPHSREVLADLLWDERAQSQALGNLRSVLTALRRQFAPYLEITRDSVGLQPQAQASTDVGEFEAHLKTARQARPFADPRSLQVALELYRGDFLEGFYLREASGFEAWLVRERERLHQLAVTALQDLVALHVQGADYPAGLAVANRLLELDPLNESAHRQAMLLLSYSGQRSAALAQFETCRRLLWDELGVEPSAETQALYDQIRAGEVAAPTPSPQVVRGYELKEQIGAGAFGAVYRAWQPAIGREVAIKVILPQFADDPAFIRRFEAEAHLVARLEHPHIVPLYDFWRQPGGAYLVMRWLRGGSLADLLAKGPLDLPGAARLVEQVASALAAAHQKGVIHRDLKPANILLDEGGNAYLSDFGIAKDLSQFILPASSAGAAGSPLYMSPEQLRCEALTPQADIYSLGILLFEVLAGELPFKGDSLATLVEQHLHAPTPALGERLPELPPDVDRVIQRATEKDPYRRYPDALTLAAEFVQAARGEALPIAGRELIPANPYKGLRAFEEADAADFFGREALTQQLLSRLAEHDTYTRFLAVVGPSGSGKSSAVKAGLLPALRAGALPGSEKWFIVEMYPHAHPLDELEVALLRLSARPDLDLAGQLRRDERGLLRAAQLALPDPHGALLLVVDQFEEVFTLVKERVEARHFMDLLYRAVTDPHSPLWVVITLRADFYDRPLMEREFASLVQKRTEVVVPMTAEELERAIRCPAERAGVSFEEGLESEIVAEVTDQLGALPLLQYSLTELYERRSDGRLTHQAYQAIGGVRAALGRRSEQVYQALDETQQALSRQVFLRLVNLGEGVEDTRRRVLLTELEALESQPLTPTPYPFKGLGEKGIGVLQQVLYAFGKARLLTFDHDPQTRGPTAEVAHEALLKEWPRLKDWLAESRADIRLQRLLAVTAADWLASGKDPSFLLRGARLAQFEEWARTSSIALTGEERACLQASRQEESARLAKEAALERRWRAFLWGLVIVFALAAVISLGLTGLARRAQSQAMAEADARATQEAIAISEANSRATQQSIAEGEAQARATAEAVALEQRQAALLQASAGLAAQALVEMDSAQPERAVLLSLEALEKYPYTPKAESALAQAVQQPNSYRNFMTGDVSGLEWSRDGKQIFAATGPRDPETIMILDAGSGEVIKEFPVPTCWDRLLSQSPDGSRLLISPAFPEEDDPDCWPQVLDLETGEILLTLPHTARSVAWSSDGNRIVTTGFIDGMVKIWDGQTGEPVNEFKGRDEPGAIADVIWMPDGRIVTVTADEDAVRFMDSTTGAELFKFDQAWPVTVGLSPDGHQLALGSMEGGMILDAVTGEYLTSLSGHSDLVREVLWSPDGDRVVTSSFDLTARIWNPTTGYELERLPLLHDYPKIDGMIWSPDGKHLLVDGYDFIREWDLTPHVPQLFGHTGYITDVQFSPDGKLIVGVGYEDETFHVWEASSGKELLAVENVTLGMYEMAWSPDSQRVIVSDWLDATARMWDVSTGELLFEFDSPSNYYYSFAWSPDGSTIAAEIHGGNAIDFLDAQTGQLLRSIKVPNECEYSVRPSWSPDGDRLTAACAGTNITYVWDASSGEILQTLEGGAEDDMFNAVWSPDGTRIATGTSNGLARVWEVATGQVVTTFAGHSSIVLDLDWSPNSSRIVSSGEDYTVKIWDAVSAEELFTYTTNDFNATVDWSPDGDYIAVAREHNPMPLILRAWQSTEDLVAYAKECCAWRELTAEEHAQFGLPPQ